MSIDGDAETSLEWPDLFKTGLTSTCWLASWPLSSLGELGLG